MQEVKIMSGSKVECCRRSGESARSVRSCGIRWQSLPGPLRPHQRLHVKLDMIAINRRRQVSQKTAGVVGGS